jgi:hypothetical protein
MPDHSRPKDGVASLAYDVVSAHHYKLLEITSFMISFVPA